MRGAGLTDAVCPPAVSAAIPNVRASAQLSIDLALRFTERIAVSSFSFRRS
jgi:hypothetical protein